MGADESKSKASPVHTYSQEIGRNEQGQDIPYTAFSLNKNENLSHNQPSKQPINEASSTPRGNMGALVVVQTGDARAPVDPDSDEDVMKMRDIPTFMPLLRGSLNIPDIQDSNFIDKLDYKLVRELCNRYKLHLKKNAEVIVERQNLITARTKEVDMKIHDSLNILTERKKQLDKHAEMLQKMKEITRVLGKSQKAVEDMVPIMRNLNAALPTNLQLGYLHIPES